MKVLSRYWRITWFGAVTSVELFFLSQLGNSLLLFVMVGWMLLNINLTHFALAPLFTQPTEWELWCTNSDDGLGGWKSNGFLKYITSFYFFGLGVCGHLTRSFLRTTWLARTIMRSLGKRMIIPFYRIGLKILCSDEVQCQSFMKWTYTIRTSFWVWIYSTCDLYHLAA